MNKKNKLKVKKSNEYDIFKIRLYGRWSNITHFFDNIIAFLKPIKFAWQRIRKGYSSYDVWGMDTWFSVVIPDMLEELADNGRSYPVAYTKYNTEDEPHAGFRVWASELKETANIIRGLNKFDKNSKYDPQKIAENKAKAFKFLSDNFYSLWD